MNQPIIFKTWPKQHSVCFWSRRGLTSGMKELEKCGNQFQGICPEKGTERKDQKCLPPAKCVAEHQARIEKSGR